MYARVGIDTSVARWPEAETERECFPRTRRRVRRALWPWASGRCHEQWHLVVDDGRVGTMVGERDAQCLTSIPTAASRSVQLACPWSFSSDRPCLDFVLKLKQCWQSPVSNMFSAAVMPRLDRALPGRQDRICSKCPGLFACNLCLVCPFHRNHSNSEARGNAEMSRSPEAASVEFGIAPCPRPYLEARHAAHARGGRSLALVGEQTTLPAIAQKELVQRPRAQQPSPKSRC